MNKLMGILEWCKSNPITLACVAVVIVSAGSFVWPTWSWRSAFKQELAGRSSDLSSISGLMNKSITVPAANPSDEPETVPGVITDRKIDALRGIFEQIEGEYERVLGFLVEFNRYGSEEIPNPHEPFMDGLFPDPGTDPVVPFTAQNEYCNRFNELFARLDAAQPFEKEEMDELINKELDRFKAQFLAFGQQQLPPDRQEQGNRLASEKLQQAIRERAAEAHIYAPLTKLKGQSPNTEDQQGGAFDIMTWPFQGDAPKTEPMWEGQMRLWIQQDLVRVLEIVNNMDDETASVVKQPVKVLKSIKVLPGYVRAVSATQGEGGVEASAATSYDEILRTGLPNYPSVSITGRVSNPLYDVRYAEMNVIVDFQQMPKLLNAFSQVNFMTVLEASWVDVDEYALFKEGYYIGDQVDAVDLTLKIETVWMRQWTAGTHLNAEEIAGLAASNEPIPHLGFMPDSVRLALNLPLRRPEDVSKALENQDGSTTKDGVRSSGYSSPAGGFGPGF